MSSRRTKVSALSSADTSSGATSGAVARDDMVDIEVAMSLTYSSGTVAQLEGQVSEDGSTWMTVQNKTRAGNVVTHTDRIDQKTIPGANMLWVVQFEALEGKYFRIIVTTDGDSSDTVDADLYLIRRRWK